MDAKQLLESVEILKQIAVLNLTQFVLHNCPMITERQRADFDIEDFEGHKATQIYDFYNLYGCSTVMQIADDYKDEKKRNDDWYNILYENFEHTTYSCIYIEIDSEFEPQLMWYGFVNGGIDFDADQAEPEHGYVRDLPLYDIEVIIRQIELDTHRPI